MTFMTGFVKIQKAIPKKMNTPIKNKLKSYVIRNNYVKVIE